MRITIRAGKLPPVLNLREIEEAKEVALRQAASKYKKMVLDYIDEGKAFKNRTETLRNSIMTAGNKVFTRVKYAPFVEFGTRPHVIKPRRKKALRFVIDGKEVFAMKVNHPGSKPYPFFYAEMEKRAKEVGKEFLKAFIKELKGG